VSHDPTKAELQAELERLHKLLDRLKSCLMRVGADGKLLAVNDAAVDLLGGGELSHVLGTNFVAYVRDDGGTLWSDFVRHVSESGAGSLECEIDDLGGTRRTLMLLGVAVSDHPDGIASMLVTVRDITTARRLEASLQEYEGARKQLSETFDPLGRTLSDSMDFATLISQILRKQPLR
jgi:PAS domain-containing protein